MTHFRIISISSFLSPPSPKCVLSRLCVLLLCSMPLFVGSTFFTGLQRDTEVLIAWKKKPVPNTNTMSTTWDCLFSNIPNCCQSYCDVSFTLLTIPCTQKSWGCASHKASEANRNFSACCTHQAAASIWHNILSKACSKDLSMHFCGGKATTRDWK